MATEGIKRLIELGVNASPAIRELEKLGQAAQKQTASIQSIDDKLASLGQAFIAGLSAGAIVGFAQEAVGAFMRVVDAMEQLGKQAESLGLSVESLQELQYAFRGAGLDAQSSVNALSRFENALANIDDPANNVSRILREIGITAADTTEGGLDKLANAFANAPDGINKTAIATELFGRRLGQQMVLALNEGEEGLARLGEKAHDFAFITEEAAQQARVFNQNLEDLGRVANALGVEIAGALLPQLIRLTAELYEAIKAGNIWGQTMDRMRRWTKDFWTGGVKDMGKNFWTFGAEPKEALKELSNLTTGWGKVGDAAETVAKKTGALPAAFAPKERAAGGGRAKTIREQIDEFTAWTLAIEKAGTTATLVPQKIAYLQDAMAGLDTSTEGGRLRMEALQKALDALQPPDAVALALKKVADEAKRLDQAPAVIEAMKFHLQDLESAGQGASTYAKQLREELLKLEAATDPVRAVTLELQKMAETTAWNERMQAAWFDALASGEATAREFAQGVNKYIEDVGEGLKKTGDRAKTLSESIAEMGARFVTDFADQIIDSLGRADTRFSDLVDSMLRQVAKLLLNAQLKKLFEMFEGASASGSGGLLGWLGGLFGAAQGAAWNAGGIEAMASGGILSRPTFFASGGRLAVAGEAGAEAVVPLQRSSSGALGVAASPVTVNIHNNAPVEVSTQNKDNADGSRQIEVYVEQKVKSMFNNGSMDRTMRQGYGLTRQPIAG